jgi:hypothetical protein
MRRRVVIVVVVVGMVLYGADFISVRVGVPRRAKLGSVTVHTYYAIKLKNGKTEYDYGGDQVVDCSNSLFPQMGVSPCWYASRHTDKQITIDSGYDPHQHIF